MEGNKELNPFAVSKMRRASFGSVRAEAISKVNGTFPPNIFWADEAKEMTAKDFQNHYLNKPRTGDGISHLLADKVFRSMMYPKKKGLKYNWKNIKKVWTSK